MFGFPSYLYAEVVQHFTTIGEAISVDPAPALDDGRNWTTIVYRNPWEAARAVRRSGEIISIGREEIMIGVKWAVSRTSLSFFSLFPIFDQCWCGFSPLTGQR